MKLKYPAEAFALGIILFSAGMKEAFVAGILVILSVVFAEFLKNLLEPFVPDWSLKASVCIGTASVSASVFLSGFSATGMNVDQRTWIMFVILGLFTAKHVLTEELEADYGELFRECGIIWGFWVLLAVVREFMGAGSIFGNLIARPFFQSSAFLEMPFGFLAAGLVLAFTNGALGKKSRNTRSMLLVAPVVIFFRPFSVESLGETGNLIWSTAVTILLFFSIKKTLKFARTGYAYRGLPSEMLAMGFLYLILSIY